MRFRRRGRVGTRRVTRRVFGGRGRRRSFGRRGLRIGYRM